MERATIFPIVGFLCFVLTSGAAATAARLEVADPGTLQPDGSAGTNRVEVARSAPQPQELKVDVYRIDAVSEKTRLDLAIPAGVGIPIPGITAKPGERFVIVRLQFATSVTSVDARSIALSNESNEVFPSIGFGDNEQVKYDGDYYCIFDEPEAKLERSDNGKSFWKSCTTREGGRILWTILRAERPAVVFSVPQSVALNVLRLIYGGVTTRLLPKKGTK